MLLQIGDSENIDLVRQLVQAHAYWRLKGLAVDLVIWNEDRGGYRQVLQDQIMGLIAAGVEAHVIDRPGGIFVRRAEQISDEDRILLQSVARAIISDRRGSLAEQVKRRGAAEVRVPRLVPTRHPRGEAPPAEAGVAPLLLANGLGGFTPDGTEYVITLRPGETTPAPWVNVLANPKFGTVVSESGLAYTWSENAHEFRLTPWHNDPVTDASGEACFLRDEETGHFWSPSPLPAAAPAPTSPATASATASSSTRGRHRHRAERLRGDRRGGEVLGAEGSQRSGRPRRLSATGYVEWVLGDLRPKTTMHVITEIDAKSGALLARNSYNTEFPDRVAFFDVDDPGRTVTGDRAEFLGRNGRSRSPAAMARTRLSGRVGAALDPCAAIQVAVRARRRRGARDRLPAGRGPQCRRRREPRPALSRPAAARAALDAVRAHWQRTLGAVQVETPDASLNVLANGWLVYQTLACRLWARSGYYQSGGAFGFRDQLQDAMALVHADRRSCARTSCAARAGSSSKATSSTGGIRRPAAACARAARTTTSGCRSPTARYVQATGDRGVLDESVDFLEGRPVNPGDDSYYDLPGRSAESRSLYEHCVRADRARPAVRRARLAADGLRRLERRHEPRRHRRARARASGWASSCTPCCASSPSSRSSDGDAPFAERCEAEAGKLRQNLEQHGWDGEWYRRAYFDDGTPLGSATNVECRIDSVSQSWSVLSGAGDRRRARTAMQAVDERLVRRDHRLIQLLDPPFDRSEHDPGYIRGYVPGVRENGGQYTHGAIWAAMAFAALGDRERAWELATMINPANHARTPEDVATYKVEPYVVAADVYARGAAHRPRRLDLVHGLGGLDVSAHRRIAARRDARGRPPALRAVPAGRVDGLHDALPVPRDDVRDRRAAGGARSRHGRPRGDDHARCASSKPAARCRCPTTAGCIRSGSTSARHRSRPRSPCPTRFRRDALVRNGAPAY